MPYLNLPLHSNRICGFLTFSKGYLLLFNGKVGEKIRDTLPCFDSICIFCCTMKKHVLNWEGTWLTAKVGKCEKKMLGMAYLGHNADSF